MDHWPRARKRKAGTVGITAGPQPPGQRKNGLAKLDKDALGQGRVIYCKGEVAELSAGEGHAALPGQ